MRCHGQCRGGRAVGAAVGAWVRVRVAVGGVGLVRGVHVVRVRRRSGRLQKKGAGWGQKCGGKRLASGNAVMWSRGGSIRRRADWHGSAAPNTHTHACKDAHVHTRSLLYPSSPHTINIPSTPPNKPPPPRYTHRHTHIHNQTHKKQHTCPCGRECCCQYGGPLPPPPAPFGA